MTKVAFLLDNYTVRGVEGVAWAYAWYNQAMLGNESVVIVKRRRDREFKDDTTDESVQRFTGVFETHELPVSAVDDALRDLGVDVCYMPVHGANDPEFVPSSVPVLTHCVFRSATTAGTLRTAVSRTVAAEGRVRVLPNVIDLHAPCGDLREELGIPRDAFVFGCIGGRDSFDIPWVRDAVTRVAADRPDIHFVFVHIRPFDDAPPANVRFLPATVDGARKRRFVDTCDAMIHARSIGETFGCACGEFAVCGKPVVTCALTEPWGDLEHLSLLGGKGVLYRDPSQLDALLRDTEALRRRESPDCGYDGCTPEHVMPLFRRALEDTLAAASQR